MKKIIGVIIIVVIIACAAIFFTQKKVENEAREWLTLLPEQYKVEAKDISYSLLSNTLTLSDVQLKGRIEPKMLAGIASPDVVSQFEAMPPLDFSGNIEEITLSGFDAFAGEEALDKPGLEIAELCKLKNYSFEVQTNQLSINSARGTIKEIEYKNMAMRSDVSINQLLNAKNLFDIITMVEIEAISTSDTTMNIGSSMVVSLEAAEASAYKNGKFAEMVLKKYKAKAYGEVLFNFGEVKVTDLNYLAMVKPSLENPPFTSIALKNVDLSPIINRQALKAIGLIEARMSSDEVKRFTLNIRDMDVSRSVADRLLGDFKGMGYPEFIRFHGNANLDVNPNNMIVQINGLELGFQDGFDAKLELGDCRLPLKAFIGPERVMNRLGDVLTLRKAVLTLVDHSFLERFKKTLTPEDREAVQELFASDIAPKKVLDGLAAQFENPGTLTISVEAPNPVSVDEFSFRLQNGTVPESWFSVVNSSTPATGE